MKIHQACIFLYFKDQKKYERRAKSLQGLFLSQYYVPSFSIFTYI